MALALLVAALILAVVACAWGCVRYARLLKSSTHVVLTTIEQHIFGLQNELRQISVLLDECHGLSDDDRLQLKARHSALITALAHYRNALDSESAAKRAA